MAKTRSTKNIVTSWHSDYYIHMVSRQTAFYLCCSLYSSVLEIVKCVFQNEEPVKMVI